MELGTGVFFASIVLGLVYLYVQTRDRWNWKKIILLPLSLIALFYGGVFLYEEWFREKPQNYVIKQIAQTEFLSIALGDKDSDVKFKKGSPDGMAMDGDVWIFHDSTVIFKDKKVRAVLYSGKCVICNQIFDDLGIGTSYEDLQGKIGEPTSVSSSADQLKRLVSFKRLNLVFLLEQNAVFQYGIYNPKQGPLIFTKLNNPKPGEIDLSRLSDEDLIELNNNNISGISDDGLRILAGEDATETRKQMDNDSTIPDPVLPD